VTQHGALMEAPNKSPSTSLRTGLSKGTPWKYKGFDRLSPNGYE